MDRDLILWLLVATSIVSSFTTLAILGLYLLVRSWKWRRDMEKYALDLAKNPIEPKQGAGFSWSGGYDGP